MVTVISANPLNLGSKINNFSLENQLKNVEFERKIRNEIEKIDLKYVSGFRSDVISVYDKQGKLIRTKVNYLI